MLQQHIQEQMVPNRTEPKEAASSSLFADLLLFDTEVLFKNTTLKPKNIKLIMIYDYSWLGMALYFLCLRLDQSHPGSFYWNSSTLSHREKVT